MDILTNVLSGIAVGAVAASLSGKDISRKGLIIACGVAGAALPDVDALTRWKGFDATAGKWLGLAENGRDIFFASHWYSHYGATHSLLAALLSGLALVIGLYAMHRLTAKKKAPFAGFAKEKAAYGAALFLGYMAHLAGDMPTPSSHLDGIKLFWPLGTAVGGWGRIWWWNNYDIFLLVYLCSVVTVFLLFACRPRGRCMKVLPAVVLAVTLAAVVYQVQTRPLSFNGTGGHARMEAASLKVQREMLVGGVYETMKSFDDRLRGLGIIF